MPFPPYRSAVHYAASLLPLTLACAGPTCAQEVFDTPRMSLLGAEVSGSTWRFAGSNGYGATMMVRAIGEEHPQFTMSMHAAGDRLTQPVGAPLQPTPDGTRLVNEGRNVTIRRDVRNPECLSVDYSSTTYLACPRRDEELPHWARPFVGEWTTASGTLSLTGEGRLLRGVVRRPDSNGVPIIIRRYAFYGVNSSGQLLGGWAYGDNPAGDEAIIKLSENGKTFTGIHRRVGQPPETWIARRKDAPGAPSSGNEGTTGGTGSVGGTAGSSGSAGSPSSQPGHGGSSTAPAGFDSLRRYDVRLDRVVRASDEARVDVFVTLRNATQGILHGTSSALKVRLEDDEGVGKQASQAFRATPHGRVHFASTPVIEPGGQLKVKFTFFAGEGGVPAKVAIIEEDKRVSYDLDF
jgi:hypothetical protein